MSDRSARVRPLLLVAALCGGLALAGCSQEGKLIQTPLPVTAVATSYLPVTTAYLASGPVLNRIINVRFKIVVHAQNACEAQHAVLELQRIDTNPATYRITPVARYNADDACVSLAPGAFDTTLVLDVNGVIFGRTDSTAVEVEKYPFQVIATNGPAIADTLDSLITDTTPNTAQFLVRVEDSALGGILENATVAIDQLGAGGSATPLDSALTGLDGYATVTVPAPADTAGAPNLPYRARVTLGARSRTVSMPSFPARLLRREKIVVRI